MQFGGIELGGALGGYEIINKPASTLPQDLASAISVVNAGKLGATYDPLWLVGKQLVNGMKFVSKFVALKMQTLLLSVLL